MPKDTSKNMLRTSGIFEIMGVAFEGCPMNAASRIVEKFGGAAALARLINKRQSTVAYWQKVGTVPAKWQAPLLKLAAENQISLTAADFVQSPLERAEDDGLPAAPIPDSKTPQSPYAQWPGVIELGGDPIDCYVLDTGERVLALRSAIKAVSGTDSGNLGNYIGVNVLKPYLDSDLVLGGLLEFTIPGTQFKGAGLTTSNFELILRGYVQALYGRPAELTDRQREIAIKCAVISAGLVRLGLDALVDEATGYQYDRASDALQVKLKAFIADELRDWEKTFPDELWQEFGRLTRWSGPLHSRPKWWGKLVLELIYDTLDPDVAIYLRENKPPPGVHWHRQLTENLGVRQLVSRCYEIVGMSKDCQDIRELRDKVAVHYGKQVVQLTLALPKPKHQ